MGERLDKSLGPIGPYRALCWPYLGPCCETPPIFRALISPSSCSDTQISLISKTKVAEGFVGTFLSHLPECKPAKVRTYRNVTDTGQRSTSEDTDFVRGFEEDIDFELVATQRFTERDPDFAAHLELPHGPIDAVQDWHGAMRAWRERERDESKCL